MAGKTKIPVTLVIEIDPQEWADEYGVAVSEVKERHRVLPDRVRPPAELLRLHQRQSHHQSNERERDEMTNAELIAELQKFDPAEPVKIKSGWDPSYLDIKSVSRQREIPGACPVAAFVYVS